MKLIVALAALLPLASIADCRHYEYAELKDMKVSDIVYEHCIAGLEIEKLTSSRDLASKLNELERKAAYPDATRIDENSRRYDAADAAIEKCRDEQGRLSDMYAKRIKKKGAYLSTNSCDIVSK